MRPMRTRAACLRQCYELGREPKDEGRVVLQFVVDVDGFVRRSKVRESELQDHAVAQCAARQIVGLQFPAPGAAPITIVYPFVFRR